MNSIRTKNVGLRRRRHPEGLDAQARPRVCDRARAALRGLKAEAGDLRVEISENQEETESLRDKMDNVGTTAQLETEARKQDFIKSGELLFEVVNEELLKNYTEEEWTILMEERKLGQF